MTFRARQNISETDQPHAGRLAIAVLMCLGLVIIGSSQGEAGKVAKAPPQGPVVAIHAPHVQQFELALDEVELDWSRVPGAKGRAFARQDSPGSGEAIADAEAVRALVTFPRLGGQAELRGKVEALQPMNPGAEAHFVVYESGHIRVASHDYL
jgi:hypothetical protein